MQLFIFFLFFHYMFRLHAADVVEEEEENK
jgi:hypothetical protein